MDATSSSDVPKPTKPRWYTPTPAKFLFAVLVMQGVLFLSTHYRWFWFNEQKGFTVLITVAATAIALLLLVVCMLISRFFKTKAQFSLATLLLMVAVVAVPCGWLARDIERARRQRAIVEAIRSHGEAFYFNTWEPTYKKFPASLVNKWVVPTLGYDFVDDIIWVECHSTTDVELEQLQDSTQLHHLNIGGSEVTDAGLKHLKGLSELSDLGLEGTGITDAGLAHLKGLPQLRQLLLGETNITDVGLADLKDLPKLERLYLAKTKVSDAGLEHVEGLPNLIYLELHGTEVTVEGVQRFKAAKPKCDIRPLRFLH